LRFVFLIVALFYVGEAYAQAHQDRKCLSYWDVGAASECKKREKEVKKAPVPEPELPPAPVLIQTPPTPPSPTVVPKVLTEKEKLDLQVEKEVDEFLENHGKPPREFARFMINPTLENALLWAQKYNDMLKRTEETTIAWMKAQHVLESKEKGELNTEIPTLESKRRAVPDYGLDWNTEAGAFAPTQPTRDNFSVTDNTEYLSDEGRIGANAEVPEPPAFNVASIDDPEQQLRNMFMLMQQMKQQEQNILQSDKKAEVPTGDVKQLLPNAANVDDGKIHVNYYFSAECPYCKQFEPRLQSVISELGSKVAVTCVDMTPTSKDIVNIYGKVDCDWRPLMPDEMKTFGIKSTPTLLVNFPNKSKVERLEGAVTAEILRDYLQ
jgi:thiol-disulfide isomerase/thioredoxin